MPNIGDAIQGKYRITSRLGAGAMGIVFSAVHLETERVVALKWLNPALTSSSSAAERFRREAKATGRVQHPNIVAVHDCGEHDGQLYMVMEYLAGRTLRVHLHRAPERRLSLHAALALLFPIARGIAAAHAAGVLHRDLKPENVMLCDSPDHMPPVPKVLDFGLAKVRSEANLKLSLPGSVLGTYGYMAPEQLRANTEVDERIDVYALGTILYEMLSGAAPYRAENAVDLMLQMHAGDVPSIDSSVPSLPAELSPVIARALARDPEARYASVEEFAFALEPFASEPFRGVGATRDAAASGVTSTPRAPAGAAEPLEQQLVARTARVERRSAPRTRVAEKSLLLAMVLFMQPTESAVGRGRVAAAAGRDVAEVVRDLPREVVETDWAPLPDEPALQPLAAENPQLEGHPAPEPTAPPQPSAAEAAEALPLQPVVSPESARQPRRAASRLGRAHAPRTTLPRVSRQLEAPGPMSADQF